MRRLTAFSTLLVVLSLAVPAAAHKGHSHGKPHRMLGTVKAVHADAGRIEMTSADGQTQDVHVTAETRYLKGTAAASLASLTPGTRVVVEGVMDGDKMTATVVKIGRNARPAPRPTP